MKKLQGAGSLATAVALTLVSSVFAADPIGSVVAIQGHVTATGTDGHERRLQLKSEIYLEDKLVSGRAARLQVMFDDDSVITQGENSEMIVDKYVYSPKDKKDAGCAMKFASGLFRVVTGKIATINPERFKVQTRMATIGIRGCEVGFLLDEEREDVFILWLPAGKSILVERTPEAGGQPSPDLPALNDMLNILQAGKAVSIKEGARLSERAISTREMRNFYSGLMIDPSAPAREPSTGQGTSEPAPPAAGSAVETGKVIRDDAQVKALQLAKADTSSSQQTTGGNAQPASAPSSRPALSDWPPANVNPSTGPTTDQGPSAPPPTDPLPPLPPLPPSPVSQGSGNGWAWVIYSDGSVDNSYSPGYQMLDNDFQAIKAGGATLVGAGQASAYITHIAGNQLVNGTCNLTVQAGALPNPTWTGSFTMQNGANNLYFNAGGSIGTAGQMSMSSLNSYALTVNSSSYDATTLTAQQLVNSFLVGPGGPVASGAHGHFFFAHGPTSDPKVDAVFGVNFP